MRDRLIALGSVTALTLAGLVYDGKSAVQITADAEGMRNTAYADPAHGWAVPTICVGHTLTARRGMWLSDKQCMDLLANDLENALGDTRQLLGRQAMLTPGEVIAYVDFVFNVGATKLERSTWRRKFLAGDRKGACREMGRWVYANKKKLKGLVTRRAVGMRACLSGL